MANVETPIISRVSTSIFLRPTRSPKCPMITAPIGRATYATPKVASESRVAVDGSLSGKNTLGNTSPAAAP